MNQSYSAWKEKCGRKIKYNQLVEKGKIPHVSTCFMVGAQIFRYT